MNITFIPESFLMSLCCQSPSQQHLPTPLTLILTRGKCYSVFFFFPSIDYFCGSRTSFFCSGIFLSLTITLRFTYVVPCIIRFLAFVFCFWLLSGILLYAYNTVWLSSWWTSGLFPFFGYYEIRCYEYSCTSLFVDMFSFLSGRYLPKMYESFSCSPSLSTFGVVNLFYLKHSGDTGFNLCFPNDKIMLINFSCVY